MLTPDQIAALRDRAGHVTDSINDFLLEDIARRVSEAGQLTSSASYQVWRAQQLGMSQREIKRELQKRLKVSRKEINKLLTQSAEVGYRFDIDRLPTSAAIPFEKNSSLQQIIDAAVKLAQDDFTNLTQTLGMVDPLGNALPLQEAYRSCTDFAFQQVITGATDYNTAIRTATKNLAAHGVRVIDYASGVHTSLEAAVRRNIMGGLGLMQEQISEHNHDLLGADGWEISAHANSAPDHEPIQGKQYTDEEYQAINGSLVRRIGTLNCGHVAFPIIMGVNEPQYTEEQLAAFRQENAKGVTVDGKHYTGYEATQMQRKIERAIRLQKSRCLVDEATGDKEKLLTDQIKLERYKYEYARFSKMSGLRTEGERAQVAGFGRKSATRAKTAAEEYYKVWSKSTGVNDTIKTLANYYDIKYNNSPRYALLERYARDVQAGWISPMSGFGNYERLHANIQSNVVGRITSGGVVVTGQRDHFMQRVIGTMVDPKKLKEDLRVVRRSGVSVVDIEDALFGADSSIDPPVVRADGKRSVRYIGKNCVVTINPDTGELIQTNLRKRGKTNA